MPRSENFIAIIEQGVFSATQFFSGIIVARTTPKEQFGLYALATTIVLFLVGMQTSLILMPYTIYAIRLKGKDRACYNGSTLLHQIWLSASAGTLLLFIGIFLPRTLSPRGSSLIIPSLAGTVPFILLLNHVRRVLFADLRFMSALVVSILSGFFQIGGLMLLAYCHLLSATTAYWMIGSSCGVVSIVWLVCNKNDYSLNFGQATSALRLNWSQGKWIFGGSMISSISTYLYPWFLATFQGVAEAGTFAACQNVANLPNPFLLSVSNILRPKTALAFTNGGPVLLMRLVKRSTLKIALVMGLYLTLMLIGGEWLTFQIYGSKYVGTGQVVLVLAIGLFAFAVTAPYGYGLIAMERADINFRITITCSLPAILLGLFLIRTYGSIGAAYSLLTFNGAVLIACFILFAGIVRPKQTK